MQALCPRCGQPAVAGQRFCSNCGYALTLTTPPPPSPSVITPPPVPVTGPPNPVPRQRGGCGCGSCLLILILLLLLGGGGGYLLYTNGVITQYQIMQAIGLGTGEMNVTNLSDESVTVTLMMLDAESQETGLNREATLKPMEIRDFTAIQPGLYKISVPRPQGPGGGTCTVKIDSGDFYRIVLVRTSTLIARDKQPARTSTDLNFPDSPLCSP
jgi:hypothetical protein